VFWLSEVKKKGGLQKDIVPWNVTIYPYFRNEQRMLSGNKKYLQAKMTFELCYELVYISDDDGSWQQ
jgi:hypothetical protein